MSGISDSSYCNNSRIPLVVTIVSGPNTLSPAIFSARTEKSLITKILLLIDDLESTVQKRIMNHTRESVS